LALVALRSQQDKLINKVITAVIQFSQLLLPQAAAVVDQKKAAQETVMVKVAVQAAVQPCFMLVLVALVLLIKDLLVELAHQLLVLTAAAALAKWEHLQLVLQTTALVEMARQLLLLELLLHTAAVVVVAVI
jgi:hypothetical protein